MSTVSPSAAGTPAAGSITNVAKIMIESQETGRSKIVEVPLPCPRNIMVLCGVLMDHYDASGEVGPDTHQLLVIDKDHRVQGPLLSSDQLQTGLRLWLLRTGGTAPVAPVAAAAPVPPNPEQNKVANDAPSSSHAATSGTIPRFGSPPRTAAAAAAAPLPSFVPPPQPPPSAAQFPTTTSLPSFLPPQSAPASSALLPPPPPPVRSIQSGGFAYNGRPYDVRHDDSSRHELSPRRRRRSSDRGREGSCHTYRRPGRREYTPSSRRHRSRTPSPRGKYEADDRRSRGGRDEEVETYHYRRPRAPLDDIQKKVAYATNPHSHSVDPQLCNNCKKTFVGSFKEHNRECANPVYILCKHGCGEQLVIGTDHVAHDAYCPVLLGRNSGSGGGGAPPPVTNSQQHHPSHGDSHISRKTIPCKYGCGAALPIGSNFKNHVCQNHPIRLSAGGGALPPPSYHPPPTRQQEAPAADGNAPAVTPTPARSVPCKFGCGALLPVGSIFADHSCENKKVQLDASRARRAKEREGTTYPARNVVSGSHTYSYSGSNGGSGGW